MKKTSARPFPVDTIHKERASGIIAGQLWDTPAREAVRLLQHEVHRIYVDVRGRHAYELFGAVKLDDYPPTRQQMILTGMLAFQVVRAYGPCYEDHLLAGEWLTLPEGGDQVTAA